MISTGGRRSTLAGTGTLVRLGLRRDRIRIAAWSVILAGLMVGIASSWDRLYPTAESRRELAATLALSPSLTAILGPLFNPISTGGLTAWRSIAGYTLVLGLIESFVVVRHTRADEQDGIAELVGAGVVGAAARSAAAFIVAMTYGLVFAILTIGGLSSLGLPVGGAIALGLAMSLAGGVFAGIAVLAAQLAHSSRGANGLAGAAVAVFFAISTVANSTTDSPLVWLTPFGWAEQTRAFTDERWWVLGVSALAGVCLATTGIVLSTRRDLGSSLIPARLGRSSASPYLRNPRALAWRLDRSWLMWWLFGSLLLGALEGSILNTSLDALAANPSMLKLIEALGGSTNLASAFIVLMIGMFALAASGYGIATLSRLRQDETSGRAELQLATPTTRESWVSGHLLTGYLGAAFVVIAGALGLGASYGMTTRALFTSLGHAIGAALITIPAVWAVLGVTTLAIGIRPRWAFAGWVALTWCVIAGWFGAILGLPEWLMKTSPFGHLSGWPGAAMDWAPELVLLAISALFVLGARAGLAHRDLPQ